MVPVTPEGSRQFHAQSNARDGAIATTRLPKSLGQPPGRPQSSPMLGWHAQLNLPEFANDLDGNHAIGGTQNAKGQPMKPGVAERPQTGPITTSNADFLDCSMDGQGASRKARVESG